MPTYSKPPRRDALTTLETLGVVACLCAGLMSGFWLFGEDLNQLAGRANADPHSTAPPSDRAPSSHKVFEGERGLRLEQRNLNQNALPAATVPLDKAAVKALLGKNSQPTQQSRPARPAANSSANRSTAARNSAASTNLAGQKTLAYWKAMNTIMAHEEAMRAAPASGLTQANAAGFINQRAQSGKYAVQAFRELDPADVDPEVVQLGQDIAKWYAQGAKLNNTASYLLNRAGSNTRRGQTGKNWANAEKAHNASVQAINHRGDQLRARLSQKYGLAFPDLR